MKRSELTENFLVKALINKKHAGLGILEKFFLGRLGKKDAAHGLPRMDEDGEWTSPTICREINCCNESHNRIYGVLQFKLDGKYKRAAVLAEILKRYKARIEELMTEFPEPITEEECWIRKPGEENLNDSQIYRRRIREYQKSVQIVQDKIDAIRESAEKYYEELLDIKNFIFQKNNGAQIVCERILCHVQQRIDYYWASASYEAYDKKRSLPPSYSRIPEPYVVEGYRQLHEEDDNRIAEIVDYYSSFPKKEAV